MHAHAPYIHICIVYSYVHVCNFACCAYILAKFLLNDWQRANVGLHVSKLCVCTNTCVCVCVCVRWAALGLLIFCVCVLEVMHSIIRQEDMCVWCGYIFGVSRCVRSMKMRTLFVPICNSNCILLTSRSCVVNVAATSTQEKCVSNRHHLCISQRGVSWVAWPLYVLYIVPCFLGACC